MSSVCKDISKARIGDEKIYFPCRDSNPGSSTPYSSYHIQCAVRSEVLFMTVSFLWESQKIGYFII